MSDGVRACVLLEKIMIAPERALAWKWDKMVAHREDHLLWLWLRGRYVHARTCVVYVHYSLSFCFYCLSFSFNGVRAATASNISFVNEIKWMLRRL